MGRKNKNRNDDDGGEEHKEGDFAIGFVSAKAAAAKEAAEANRGDQPAKKSKKGVAIGDSDEEIGQMSKKQAKKRRQQALEDAEFGGLDQKEQASSKAEEKKGQADDSDEPAAQDLQKAMEENFEGAGAKRNTRKKKDKQANIYGDGADDALAGAFDEGADSDEIHAKKGGKNKQKNKKEHQGKKKKKQDSDHEAEDPEQEESKEQAEAVKSEGETEAPEFPINMLYCAKCNLPPEYCSFGQKDITACKEWLQGTHPVLYKELYGDLPEPKEGDSSKPDGDKVGEEEKKGDDEAADEKPKKKVKFNKELGVIQIHKQKRGGKKIVCQMVGFEYYTKDMKGLASKFGKKFSCGCNVATDDILGECISIQGDVEFRLEELIETDKDIMKLEIPIDKIRYEDMGNKKGRKRG